jgi:hypothetical protein
MIQPDTEQDAFKTAVVTLTGADAAYAVVKAAADHASATLAALEVQTRAVYRALKPGSGDMLTQAFIDGRTVTEVDFKRARKAQYAASKVWRGLDAARLTTSLARHAAHAAVDKVLSSVRHEAAVPAPKAVTAPLTMTDVEAAVRLAMIDRLNPDRFEVASGLAGVWLQASEFCLCIVKHYWPRHSWNGLYHAKDEDGEIHIGADGGMPLPDVVEGVVAMAGEWASGLIPHPSYLSPEDAWLL